MIVGLHSLTLVLLALLARSCVCVLPPGMINEADCVANVCFAALNPPTGLQHDLIRTRDSAKFKAAYESSKIGIYVKFDSPTFFGKWQFELAYPTKKTMFVKSMTIGDSLFEMYNDRKFCNGKDYSAKGIIAHCEGKYPDENGADINMYALTPTTKGQDFGTATGIYGGVANQIKFAFEDGTTYTGIGLVDIPLVHLCSRNLDVDSSTIKNSDNTMLTCEGTNMISYRVRATGIDFTPTLEDLTCDKDGWKAGTTVIATQPTIPLTVECVESCKMELIDACAGGSTSCKTPDLLGNRMLTCLPGFILYAESKVEQTQIECKKKSFENAEKSINIVRTDPNTKAKVDCLSKCHEKFVQRSGSAALQAKIAADGKYELTCDNDVQYTTVKFGSSVKYSAQSIVCDPLAGWRAVDIKNNAVFADFDYVNKIEAGCVDVCKERVDPMSCPSSLGTNCQLPTPTTGSATLTCGPAHILRYDGNDYIRKDVQCKKLGTNQPGDPPLLTVDFANTLQQYGMQCISNCAAEFVTGLTATSNQLTCRDPDILIVDRAPQKIFEALTCVEAVGWKTSAPGLIVDFSKEVKLSASCFEVCKTEMVDDVCDVQVGSPTPECISLRPPYRKSPGTLTCSNNDYRVFINDKQCEYEDNGKVKECEEKIITCKREGWFADTRTFVDFKDPSVDIMKPIKVTCKHKCSAVFVEDSCKPGTVVAGKTTCSKVNYAKADNGWQMSCTHPNEIVVLEQGDQGTSKKESFGTATCSNAGWKDDKGAVMFDLSGNVYKIRARCENLCHPDLLQGTTTASRKYDAETALLTCTAEKEMLKFDNVDVFSDLTCSKEGWKTQEETTPAPARSFTPDTQNVRMPKAECVKNTCIRDFEAQTICKSAEKFCSMPDFSQKYKVSCQAPKKLLRFKDKEASSKDPQAELICEGGDWKKKRGDATAYMPHADPFDLFCSASECTACTDTLPKAPCASGYCPKIEFVKGDSVRTCSRYVCPSSHYQITKGDTNTYYVGENQYGVPVALQCMNDGSFVGPKVNGKQLPIDGSVGCIEQIPCFEHSPLDVSCTSLKVECDSNKLETKLKAGSKKVNDKIAPVKCDDPEQLFLMTGDNEWTVIDHLKCNKEGEWDAKNPKDQSIIEVTMTQKKDRKPLARVVCSASDPTILPATTTEAPPDPMTQTCHYCPLPGALTCDKCLSASDNLKMEAKNGVCTAKLSTAGGRFIVNDDKSETSELRCKKDAEGNYVWRDDKGKAVAKMAAAEPKLTDKMNVMVIVGIVVGSIVALGAIAGLIVYGYIRRKREAKRIEELKFKGLSQRIDTIIDKVSIEDPQTVRL